MQEEGSEMQEQKKANLRIPLEYQDLRDMFSEKGSPANGLLHRDPAGD